MGLVNFMADKIRQGMWHFLQFNPAQKSLITIDENMDFLTSCAKNRLWYAGKSKQLSQLYEQLDVPNEMFWKSEMTKGMEIRKIHIPLASLIVDTMAKIVTSDYNGVEIANKSSTSYSETWANIEKDSKLDEILKTLLTDIGIVGDGAFKISFDKDISKLPIVEWYPGERVEFKCNRGRIREIDFYTEYVSRGKRYQFVESYGYGYIKYKLKNDAGKEVLLNSIEETRWIDGKGVTFDKSVIWAVPVIFGKSSQYSGRGKSLIEDKDDAFDSLDEAWSQWMDALRAGRTKQYIPDCMIPKNPNTGENIKPNAFDNRFIRIETDMSEGGSGNRIVTESPVIQHESYLNSYITALDLCLQGVISPSTLGIDVKKLDNAEAQREKEKTTLYTRQSYVELLESIIPQLVKTALNVNAIINKQSLIPSDLEVTVKFGEYANPSFESQVETVGKARQSGIMSIEAGIDELYGDSKDDDWKLKEANRIKEEMGIAVADETSEADDIPTVGF